MTQTQAAERCSMPFSQFNRLVNGCHEPVVSNAIRVAKGIGCTVEEAFGDAG